jgi:hypothetical protein
MPESKNEELVELDETESEAVEVDISEETSDQQKVEVVSETEPDEEIETEEDDNADPYPTEEELASLGKKTQKRINKLTAKLREAERRETAALDYANSVKTQNESLQTQQQKLNESYGQEYKGRITTDLEAAKQRYMTAYENGDPEELANASQDLSKLSIESAAINNEVPILRNQQQPLLNQTPASAPPPDPRSTAWAAQNEWFGVDEPMTYAAFAIHKNLLEQKFDPNSDAYYQEIDRRLRTEFPQKFNGQEETQTSATPRSNSSVQRVTSATRAAKPSGRNNSVKLTSSQVAIANKLGVPLEEYARQVKEINANV